MQSLVIHQEVTKREFANALPNMTVEEGKRQYDKALGFQSAVSVKADGINLRIEQIQNRVRQFMEEKKCLKDDEKEAQIGEYNKVLAKINKSELDA